MNRYLLLLFFFAPFTGQAQTYFNKLYDVNNSADAGSSVLETDSTYIITGVIVNPTNTQEFAIIITDKNGKLKYNKSHSYGWTIAVRSGQTILLKNGNIADYRTLQEYDSSVNNYRTWSVLSIYDPKGDKLWSKQYKDPSIFWLAGQALVETKDSGFVLVADKEVSDTSNNPVLIRIDKNGKELYRKEIKTDKREEVYSIVKYPDGGYILAGGGNSSNNKYFDPWVVRVDSNLDISWSKKYPYGRGIAAKAIVTKDSNIVFSCDSIFKRGSNMGSYRVIKIFPTGIIAWEKNHFIPNEMGGYFQPIELVGGDLLLLGGYFEGSAAVRTLTKLTSEGDTIWMNLYYYDSPGDQNYLRDFISTNDGGFLLGGDVSPRSAGTGQDLWLLKVDSNGCSTPDCKSRVYDIRVGIDFRKEVNIEFRIYPNPIVDQLNIELIGENTTSDANWSYILLNVQGIEMQQGIFQKEKTLNMSRVPSGSYLIKLENGPLRKVYRVVKE